MRVPEMGPAFFCSTIKALFYKPRYSNIGHGERLVVEGTELRGVADNKQGNGPKLRQFLSDYEW